MEMKKPCAPQKLYATERSVSSIALKWFAPQSVAGLVDVYEVWQNDLGAISSQTKLMNQKEAWLKSEHGEQGGEHGEPGWTLVSSVIPTCFHNATGLQPGHVYAFKFRAHNHQGWGDFSRPFTFETKGKRRSEAP